MNVLLLLLACKGGADSASARDVAFDSKLSGTSARTVQGAIDELYTRCGQKEAAAAEAEAAPIADETASLATRVSALELRQAEIQNLGLYAADRVAYDPRKTTMAGKTVQEALDELATRVQRLEDASIDRGQAGPALFELRDKHGKPVQLTAPGDAGPNGGKPGGPPGQPMPPGGQPGQPPPGGMGKK